MLAWRMGIVTYPCPPVTSHRISQSSVACTGVYVSFKVEWLMPKIVTLLPVQDNSRLKARSINHCQSFPVQVTLD